MFGKRPIQKRPTRCLLPTAHRQLYSVSCLLYSVRALPTTFKRIVLLTTFAVYLAVAAALTVVPTHLSRVRSLQSAHINLTPFDYSYRCYRDAFGTYRDLKFVCVRNTLGNIALFLPLGVMLPLISNRIQTLKRVFAVAILLAISIEATQFVLRFVGNPRAVDIDDVILNTLGACLGFGFYKSFLGGYGGAGAAEDGEAIRAAVPADSTDSE